VVVGNQTPAANVMKLLLSFILMILISGCGENKSVVPEPGSDTTSQLLPKQDKTLIKKAEEEVRVHQEVIQAQVLPDSLLAFARTLQGTPYCYASTDPAQGFDCSGFITYVFNHFGITVPRSSVDFTNYGKEIDTTDARPGDLILFTGTDSMVRVVGHMGIIERIQNGKIYFIHSTSGRNGLGVVISPLEKYYRSRFVKVIRVFDDKYFH
jgi:cell wall-associated NlpC family hydrolase